MYSPPAQSRHFPTGRVHKAGGNGQSREAVEKPESQLGHFISEMPVIHARHDDTRVLVGNDGRVQHRPALHVAARLCQLRDLVATPVVDEELSVAHVCVSVPVPSPRGMVQVVEWAGVGVGAGVPRELSGEIFSTFVCVLFGIWLESVTLL